MCVLSVSPSFQLPLNTLLVYSDFDQHTAATHDAAESLGSVLSPRKVTIENLYTANNSTFLIVC